MVAGERDLVAEFEAAYAATPPWDIGRPQLAFASLAAEGRLGARVLDVGCGTGEHVLMAAQAGCDAVGIDISPSAIHLAEAKARERGIRARFEVGDARQLHSPRDQFETVLDCGLFHIFDDDDREPFVESLGRVLRPGGRYVMLCFSDEEPPGWGRRAESHRPRSVRRSPEGGKSRPSRPRSFRDHPTRTSARVVRIDQAQLSRRSPTSISSSAHRDRVPFRSASGPPGRIAPHR